MFSLDYGKSFYVDMFKDHICKTCGLCQSTTPSFCMVAYGGNRERFYKLLKYILALKTRKPQPDFLSFEAFCGIFCNSGKCPQRTAKCDGVDQLIQCYSVFLQQFGYKLETASKAIIYKKFSGIETKRIGERFKLSVRDPLKLVSKKLRGPIKQAVKNAREGMKQAIKSASFGFGFMGPPSQNHNKYNLMDYKPNNAVQNHTWIKRKKPTTELICNDDEEWRAKIEEYLAPVNETNNRQSAKSAEHTSGN